MTTTRPFLSGQTEFHFYDVDPDEQPELPKALSARLRLCPLEPDREGNGKEWREYRSPELGDVVACLVSEFHDDRRSLSSL
ncbi:hypothetical protein [Anthocerotibacter panamensis]|uniref:hypothetical protein n=1 Tax=Anthocerotibacter panamensis TaxID=2857077 RepID=UPI001C401F8F|nr:hypothetical protein [Anthocerotibacter panamensis]